MDKTLRKLRKPTTSIDNDICNKCYLLLVEQGKGCTIQSVSADQRGQRQSKSPHYKETKGKKSGKTSSVSSSFMSLVESTASPLWCDGQDTRLSSLALGSNRAALFHFFLQNYALESGFGQRCQPER